MSVCVSRDSAPEPLWWPLLSKRPHLVLFQCTNLPGGHQPRLQETQLESGIRRAGSESRQSRQHDVFRDLCQLLTVQKWVLNHIGTESGLYQVIFIKLSCFIRQTAWTIQEKWENHLKISFQTERAATFAQEMTLIVKIIVDSYSDISSTSVLQTVLALRKYIQAWWWGRTTQRVCIL